MKLTCKTIRDLINLRDELGLTALSIDHQLHSYVRLVWASGESQEFSEDDVTGMERYLRSCDG